MMHALQQPKNKKRSGTLHTPMLFVVVFFFGSNKKLVLFCVEETSLHLNFGGIFVCCWAGSIVHRRHPHQLCFLLHPRSSIVSHFFWAMALA